MSIAFQRKNMRSFNKILWSLFEITGGLEDRTTGWERKTKINHGKTFESKLVRETFLENVPFLWLLISKPKARDIIGTMLTFLQTCKVYPVHF